MLVPGKGNEIREETGKSGLLWTVVQFVHRGRQPAEKGLRGENIVFFAGQVIHPSFIFPEGKWKTLSYNVSNCMLSFLTTK